MTPDLCGATTRRATASWASRRAAATEILAVWPPLGASRGPRSALSCSAIPRRVIAHRAIGVGLPDRALLRATFPEVLAT
ncbi:hypothetical protein [Dactylosporangium sp. NPDC050588]|uniref:hypothetical protein n=1 Tax=Dactylosporangium sp. NPDC050588 TaxID=3157211 RepID=UPI0033FA8666